MGVGMATFTALRICKGLKTPKIIGTTGLLKVSPSGVNCISKKNVSMTSALQGRVYGPEWEPGLPSNAKHWKQERILSAVLIPVIPAALVYPNIVSDMVLATTVMLHTHW